MEALAVIWAPVRTLASVAEERRVLLGFIITALYAGLGLIGAGLAVFSGLTQAQLQSQGADLPPEFENILVFANVFAFVSAVVSPFILWLLVSGLMQLVTRLFRGTGPFSGMLAVVGVAEAPLVILTALQIPVAGLQILLTPDSPMSTILGSLSSLLSLAALLWFVVLVVIGAAFARHIGYGESTGSCAISCAGLVGLILVVVVIFVVLIVAILGASNPGGTS